MSVLELQDVRAGYGSASVLHGVSFAIEEGEIAVLLGANGVGKTTTLRVISGLLRRRSGAVLFDGKPVDRLGAEKIVRLGVGMVPAPPGVFREMSVRDNLRVGALGLPHGQHVRGQMELVLVTFPVLATRLEQAAGSLSGGEQRMLAIARALMGRPRLLLVDEASMGLSPAMVSTVLRLLERVRRDGVTIVMAEQNTAAVDIADRALVIEKGKIVRDDTGEGLATTRTEVARAYLGGRARLKVAR